MKQSDFFRQIFWLPLAIGALFAVLGFTQLFKSVESGLYDIFLAIKPEIKQSKDIVLLDVDDQAIDSVGVWPWPRNQMADGIMTLRELGARYAVFDIEYLNPSPPGVDLWYLKNGLRQDIDHSVGEISSGIGDLFGAIESRQVRMDQAHAFTNDLIGQAEALKDSLYKNAERVQIDNDLYLGQALGYFGNAYITLNVQPQNAKQLESSEALVAQKFSYGNANSNSARKPLYQDFYIPLPSLIERAKGAGFVNVEIDPDGKRRRISLIEQVKGKFYAQLVLRPVLDMMGDPQIKIGTNSIIIQQAKFPTGKTQDLNIPLDNNGLMLINWSHGNYLSQFRHISFNELVQLQRIEQTLLSNLDQLSQRQAWQFINSNPANELANAYRSVGDLKRSARESGSDSDRETYLKARLEWISQVNAFLNADYANQMDTKLNAAVETQKGEQKELLILERTKLSQAFTAFSESYKSFIATRERLSKDFQNALCIIGWVGTGTTDIGVNPFQKDYVNVGTHASVANTILQNQFLSEAPIWLPLALTLILPFGVVWLIRNQSPLRQNIIGLAAVVGTLILSLSLFVTLGYFVPVVGMAVAILFAYLSFSLIRFFVTEQDKNFLRKAFGTYLSGDVVNELINNPDRLKLGGERLEMTAMFTDVKGFSTISEKLEPENLVSLLNQYLSAMSDIVLNNGGTIDKYEGDAIIAFWGAPLPRQDHAYQACLSAIRMKQVEVELNKRFLADDLSPSELLTRIGINTGDMVVGNMGTERKMDYTMMGSNVNLAARLEGVNKYYGTWILASDSSISQCNGAFTVRRLDRVRVVGINTPVQLYELVGLAEETSPETLARLEEFHTALGKYEAQDWKSAQKAFAGMLKAYPNDGPAQTYLRKATEFAAKPPREGWDGVVSLTEK